MLRIIQNSHAAGAKSYYSSADYYTEGQELEGRWRRSEERRVGKEGRAERATDQEEDGIRDWSVTGVQTCALPIYNCSKRRACTARTDSCMNVRRIPSRPTKHVTHHSKQPRRRSEELLLVGRLLHGRAGAGRPLA